MDLKRLGQYARSRSAQDIGLIASQYPDSFMLDEHYVLVRALFAWQFQRVPAARIDVRVDSTFILYIDQGVPKIVFQHEHEDFRQALQASGILPTQSQAADGVIAE
jgi:hypothetical protein